jgi:hypothetical protein
MRLITTIILAFSLMSAGCQEPDTHCHSDSALQNRVEFVIDSMSFIVESREDVISSLLEEMERRDSINAINPDTVNYLRNNLSGIITTTEDGLRFDFVDLSIDRRFHFYYANQKRSIILADSLKASGMFNFDLKE